jgi:cytochrome c
MASRISLALALVASAMNTLVASALATFLTFSVALAITQQFGTAEEARAMLDRAAALKTNEAKALRDFNDTNNKLFHDRDLYISCFNTSDGKFTAAPSAMLGTDIRTFNVGDDPIGQRAFDAVQATPEGTVVAMDFNFPKAGKPAVKESLEARVGNHGCGVSF